MKKILSLSFVVVVACAEGAAVPPPATEVPAPSRAGAEEEGSPPPPLVYEEVNGTLATDLDEPIPGRAIVIVDARGKRLDTVSFEGGLFHAEDVATPYDIAIAPAPSGDVVVPTVIFGLSRNDPHIELFERDGPVGRPPGVRLVLAVAPPPCATKTCVVSATSGSDHGGSVATATYAGACAAVPITLEHEWSAPFVPAGEEIDVHVVTSDADRTSFSHASVVGVEATAGEALDLGVVVPTIVANVGPVTIDAAPSVLPLSFERTLGAWIDFPGGASVPLFVGRGSSLVTLLPAIPGATVRAATWGLEPTPKSSPSTYVAAHAWSGSKSIASGTIDLEPVVPPTPVRPERDGAMSRRGAGMAWTSPTKGLATVTLIDAARNVMRLRAVTEGDEIPIAQLLTLGLARLEPGPHVIDIATHAGEGVDHAASPDPLVRRRRFDPRVAGRATYQRYPFMVTP